uniref:Uncharacterized protein n=1 Tax=Noccaea caerulescens TaxID=107243 RepID=A0A1J3GIN4_NOCCA
MVAKAALRKKGKLCWISKNTWSHRSHNIYILRSRVKNRTLAFFSLLGLMIQRAIAAGGSLEGDQMQSYKQPSYGAFCWFHEQKYRQNLFWEYSPQSFFAASI